MASQVRRCRFRLRDVLAFEKVKKSVCACVFLCVCVSDCLCWSVGWFGVPLGIVCSKLR